MPIRGYRLYLFILGAFAYESFDEEFGGVFDVGGGCRVVGL